MTRRDLLKAFASLTLLSAPLSAGAAQPHGAIYDWRVGDGTRSSLGRADAWDETTGRALPRSTFYIDARSGEYRWYVTDRNGLYYIRKLPPRVVREGGRLTRWANSEVAWGRGFARNIRVRFYEHTHRVPEPRRFCLDGAVWPFNHTSRVRFPNDGCNQVA